MTQIPPNISPMARNPMPSVKGMPAAFEAMTTENGLIVENAVPIDAARKIAPTHTMASYPSAKNTGTRIG